MTRYSTLERTLDKTDRNSFGNFLVVCCFHCENVIYLFFVVWFRFILHAKKTGFVVEHDFIMATYLADRVIVFEGQPSISCVANTPQSLLSGMNKFLKSLDITFRRDPTNFRPRINKLNSVKVKSTLILFIYLFIICFDHPNTFLYFSFVGFWPEANWKFLLHW